jgi:translation initiation factor IF-3
VNHRIRVRQVRCLDANGEMLGVMETQAARDVATKQGMDLVEISPNADPPVCRIMDFGKFRYDEKRKQRDARKHQHSLPLKEVKFHANVEEHDYQTKLSKIRGFLAKGHKVKISLFFRGRENAHRELGFVLLNRTIKDCEDICGIDMPPRLIGRAAIGVISPKAVKPVKAPKASTLNKAAQKAAQKAAAEAEPEAKAEAKPEAETAPKAKPEPEPAPKSQEGPATT